MSEKVPILMMLIPRIDQTLFHNPYCPPPPLLLLLHWLCRRPILDPRLNYSLGPFSHTTTTIILLRSYIVPLRTNYMIPFPPYSSHPPIDVPVPVPPLGIVIHPHVMTVTVMMMKIRTIRIFPTMTSFQYRWTSLRARSNKPPCHGIRTTMLVGIP